MRTRSKRPDMYSIVPVARILHAEGFNDYTANLCNKWWWRRKDVGIKHAKYVKTKFSEIVKERGLSEHEKQVLGKFVGLHKNMSFEAGFAAGTMTRLHRNTFWHKLRDLFN